jgi:hypothetical protein
MCVHVEREYSAFTFLLPPFLSTMQSARIKLWATEPEIDEELAEVDIGLAIGSYGQNGMYDDSTLIDGNLDRL